MNDNFRHAQYREDGTQIDDPQKVNDFTAATQTALQALVPAAGNLSATYDGSGRLSALARTGGRSVAVTYPTATSMVVTEQGISTPAILTATLDGGGRVASLVTNW